jgi:GMP synthase (glutamine-hydrolysing)
MEAKILIVKHIENEGAGLIEEIFRTDGWNLETVELSMGDTLPENLEGIAAAVILGGPMNVYEESKYPFLKDEDRLIRKVLVEEVPFLGICLGAQLLAKTCGARVEKASEKEIGWHTITLTEEGKRDSLFRGCSNRLAVFQWHEDTFDVPKGGDLLAVGKRCRNQVFRIGNHAYGLQCHTEITPDMVEDWMRGEEANADVAGIMSDTNRLCQEFRKQAVRLFSNFKQMIDSSLRTRRVMKIFVEDEKNSKKKKSVLWWNLKEHSLVASKV